MVPSTAIPPFRPDGLCARYWQWARPKEAKGRRFKSLIASSGWILIGSPRPQAGYGRLVPMDPIRHGAAQTASGK